MASNDYCALVPQPPPSKQSVGRPTNRSLRSTQDGSNKKSTKMVPLPPISRSSKSTRGEVEGLLTRNDLTAIQSYISMNGRIGHQHRRGKLTEFIPQSPFVKNKHPHDDVTGLQLAPLIPNESAIDIPIRLAPPPEYHSPIIIDPRATATDVQKMFSFMKSFSGVQTITDNTVDVPTSPGSKGRAETTSSTRTQTAATKGYDIRAFACRRAGHRKQEAISYFNTAVLSYNTTNFEKAQEILAKANAVFNEVSDRQGLALTHSMLGICAFRLRHYSKAIEHFRKVDDLCGAYGKAVAKVNLGVVYGAMQDSRTAMEVLTEAVEDARRTKDMCIESIALGNLGLACLKRGNLKGAQTNLEGCLELCSLAGDQTGAAACLLLLGEVYALVKDNKHAQFYFANALRVAIDGGAKDIEQVARVNIGVARGNEQFGRKCAELASLMGRRPKLAEIMN